MYSDYSTIPMNRYQSASNSSSSYSSMPVSSMSSNMPVASMPISSNYYSDNGDRFIGGFAFPFLLGGVTGAALAPSFWRPGYRPYPQPYPMYPGPYPYYRPF